MSRKRAYTEYIVNEHGFVFKLFSSYLNMPRKKKKRIKRHIERTCFYDRKKKRVTFFNLYMLSTPIPSGISEMFKPIMPPTSGETIRFTRFE